MYNVSDDIIEAYKEDGVHKEFRVVLNGVSYGNDKIVDGSLNLKQSIMDGENFEAIGCISSSLSIELHAQFPTKIRDQRIKLYVKAGDTQELQIFDGYVNKCSKTANGWKRSIEAYDLFYKMSGQSGMDDENEKKKYDITEWYNEHESVSIASLLNEVCSKFSISVRTGNHPLECGSIITECGKNKKVTSLSALDLIKAIMQINACFGYITGDGYFSWKYLLTSPYDDQGWLYPSAFLYPESTVYPGQDEAHAHTEGNCDNFIGEYERLEYEDFKMLPITKVIVRDYENDEHPGTSTYSGTAPDNNSYIIQGNILVAGASQSIKEEIASRVFQILNCTWYVPFTADLQGLPYLECGDEVNFYDFIDDYVQASLQRFHILSRTITGGQHLKDSYSASGNEYQHEFVTGSGQAANADEVVDEVKDYVDDKIAGASSAFKIVSVTSYNDIPANPDPNTLYCVQSEMLIVDSFDEYHNNTGDTAPEDTEPETENGGDEQT